MKFFYRIIIIFFIFFCVFENVYGQSSMKIISDRNEINEGEELVVEIEIYNAHFASLTLEIYWDLSKLEYVNGPENSNFLNNRLRYVWVSENGRNVDELKIGEFVFRGLQEGIVNIVVSGEFYNEDGEEINIDNDNLEVKIVKENSIEDLNEYDVGDVSLSVLRLNHEGINPDFQKDLEEYYFIADLSITDLEVTAVSENPNASVIVTGNHDLKIGKNVIEVRVVAEDGSREKIYRINVTRTSNVEMANANLENLAIRQGEMNLEFDYNVTEYYVEIPYEDMQIDILAVPQNQNSSVKIIGNDGMEIGDNEINIMVLAEDGITSKQYNLTVHRRNEEEEIQHEKEEEIQLKMLEEIIQNKEDDVPNLENENEIGQINIQKIVAIIIIFVFIFVILKSRFN